MFIWFQYFKLILSAYVCVNYSYCHLLYQEQKAIAQYQVALQLEQKGEWEQTEKILRDLLKRDIITQV